jgi:hypothetical protein
MALIGVTLSHSRDICNIWLGISVLICCLSILVGSLAVMIRVSWSTKRRGQVISMMEMDSVMRRCPMEFFRIQFSMRSSMMS